MAETRIRISKQTEMSNTPGSLVVSDTNNEQSYMPPGTNGQVLSVSGGTPSYENITDILNAQNGLSEISPNTIELGGTLLHDTSIDQGTFNFEVGGTVSLGRVNEIHSGDDAINLGVSGISITTTNSNSGIMGYMFTGDSSSFGGSIDQVDIGVTDFSSIAGQTYIKVNSGEVYYYSQANTPSGFSSLSMESITGNFSLNGSSATNNSYGYIQTNLIPTLPEVKISVGDTLSPKINDIILGVDDCTITKYPNNRDDSTFTTPINFLYTDVNGKLLSTSLSQIIASRIKDIQTGLTVSTLILPSIPNPLTLDVYLNGSLLTETIDFTISGNIITFVVPLVSTDIINSIYFT